VGVVYTVQSGCHCVPLTITVRHTRKPNTKLCDWYSSTITDIDTVALLYN